MALNIESFAWTPKRSLRQSWIAHARAESRAQ